jgi:hypothetical protein
LPGAEAAGQSFSRKMRVQEKCGRRLDQPAPAFCALPSC